MKDNQKKVKEIKNLEKYGNFVDISGSSVGEVEKNTDLDDFDSESFITLEEIQRQKIKKNRSKQVEKNQKKIDSEIEKNHKQIQRKIKKNLKLAANASKNEKKSSRKKNKGEVPVKAKKVSRLRTSIGAKLIFMISLVVVLSLLSVTFIVSYFVSEDVRISAEENNLTINARMSADCASRIDSVVSSIEMFISSLGETKDKNEEAKNASVFFEQYDDISSVILPDSQRVFNNTKFLTIHEIDFDKVSAYCESCEDEINNSRLGNFKLKNASSFFGKPMLAIYSPIQGSKTDSCVLILYSSESLYENFSSSSVNQSFYVNMEGEILVSPDLSVMLESQDWSENAVVKEMQSSKTDNGQKHYKIGDEKTDGAENIDGAGETNGTRGITFFTSLWKKIGFDLFNNDEYVGAFTKLTDSNSSVITTVELSVILEGVRRTTFRNLYLTGAILAIAIMIMWLYSRSISLPLKQLASVADEINQANFNTPLFDELETKSHDEVSVLVNSTKNEREILNTITKLTNIGVVKSVIRKEVDFEPHLKDITIFFSDIRGFTAISDGFNSRFGKKSGAEIIGFLNDYMSRMVQCITITGGVVDKFEGDAIMACWGVLRNDSLDFEELPLASEQRKKLENEHEMHKKQDALSAIKATVAMRYSLRKYNKDAQEFTEKHAGELYAKYKPHIRIGSGLNSGRATVGFMGSWEKMEFTSIGDAVNLASRTESSNKPCGTDILITQDTYDLLKMDFIKCPENNFTILPQNEENEIIIEMIPVEFEVKGKGKQHFYGVVNMPHFNVQEFFRLADKNFKADEDCLDVVGEKGPKTLKEMRILLGIPEPNFGAVNLNEEENKIKVSAS